MSEEQEEYGGQLQASLQLQDEQYATAMNQNDGGATVIERLHSLGLSSLANAVTMERIVLLQEVELLRKENAALTKAYLHEAGKRQPEMEHTP